MIDIVTEHAYLTITSGAEAEFERAFAVARPILESAQGCRGAALFRDRENAGSYLLRVTWDRLEDHLEVFPASEAGRRFAEHIAHFFALTPEVRHFETTGVGEPAS
ncbi:MAG TPA: antibiotic biosynthesis monooxygenase family protein [Pseudonocardia sp.]|nr:antibiotic biosynthesis monooxygenase family protein [Pseudonocardia sp.]